MTTKQEKPNRNWENELPAIMGWKPTPSNGNFISELLPDEIVNTKRFIREVIEQALAEQREGIVKMIESKRKTPTKHDCCTLDDGWCYDHRETMNDEDYPNGATDYNRGIDDIITSITKETL